MQHDTAKTMTATQLAPQSDLTRRISIVEALQLSSDIVNRAETGREAATIEEASRTIELESDS